MLLKSIAMPMWNILSASLILFLICSCGRPTTSESARDSLDSILGTWNFEGGELTETWSKLDDDHYLGVVNRSFNGVLEPVQHIDILFTTDSVIYTGTRIGAHESALPIQYYLNSAEENSLGFAHPEGRFPQEIRYEVASYERFSVTMSGTQDGRSRSKRFDYHRVSGD